MLGGGVDAATLMAALGAGPPPPECRWGRRPHRGATAYRLEFHSGGGEGWPFQYNVLLIVVCARISRPFILRARLHCPDCCNTITRLLGNMRPRPDPPFVCHRPYNIGNNNIV